MANPRLKILDIYHSYDGPVSGVAHEESEPSILWWVHAYETLSNKRIFECVQLPPSHPLEIKYISEDDIDWGKYK